MIEQQLYTRSSKGYFINAPGYDTVRISDGLNKEFAKENNKYFTYKGKNVKGIPDQIQIIMRQILPDGTIMLNGSNPYRYSSYDGIKEAFISHSYYIEPGSYEDEEQMKDTRKIAGVTDFLQDHIDGSNEPLEQLFELPYDAGYPEESYVGIIKTMYDPDFFTKLVYYAVDSAISGKKLYLIAQDICDQFGVMDLLKALYYFVPYTLRNRLGYITMLNEQFIPEGVNIAFVPETYITEAKSGNLFGTYINNDYCADLLSQSFIFEGETPADTTCAFYNLVKRVFTSENIDSARVIEYLDAQACENGAVSFDRLNLVSSFAAPGNDIGAIVRNYIQIRRTFNTDYSQDKFKNYLSLYAKSVNNDILPEKIEEIISAYDYVDDNGKDVLYETVVSSIEVSANRGDQAQFFGKISACDASKDISTMILSRFVITNENAIKLYLNKSFERINNISALVERTVDFETDSIFADDRFTEKPNFIGCFLARAKTILDAELTLKSVTDYNDGIKRIKSVPLTTEAKKQAASYAQAFARTVDPIKLLPEELRLFERDFGPYVTDKKVMTKIRVLLEEFDGASKATNILEGYFGGSNFYLADSVDYYRSYFESNEIDGRFLAYSIANYDIVGNFINVRAAMKGFTSIDELVEYINWLCINLRYIRSDNQLNCSKGFPSQGFKYEDTANAINLAISDFDSIDSKNVPRWSDSILSAMTVRNPELEEIQREFDKALKKAFSKKFARVNYTDASDGDDSRKKLFKPLFKK